MRVITVGKCCHPCKMCHKQEGTYLRCVARQAGRQVGWFKHYIPALPTRVQFPYCINVLTGGACCRQKLSGRQKGWCAFPASWCRSSSLSGTASSSLSSSNSGTHGVRWPPPRKRKRKMRRALGASVRPVENLPPMGGFPVLSLGRRHQQWNSQHLIKRQTEFWVSCQLPFIYLLSV